MINLIPTEGQKKLQREYQVRVVVIFSMLFGFVFLFLGVALVPTYVLVGAQMSSLQSEASQGSTKNDAFLKKLISMIDDGKIDTLKPDTLINHAVYDILDELKQGNADIEALNLLSAIRDIYGLYKAGFENSFQMENLVERLRTTKERIEEVGGDLFVI